MPSSRSRRPSSPTTGERQPRRRRRRIAGRGARCLRARAARALPVAGAPRAPTRRHAHRARAAACRPGRARAALARRAQRALAGLALGPCAGPTVEKGERGREDRRPPPPRLGVAGPRPGTTAAAAATTAAAGRCRPQPPRPRAPAGREREAAPPCARLRRGCALPHRAVGGARRRRARRRSSRRADDTAERAMSLPWVSRQRDALDAALASARDDDGDPRRGARAAAGRGARARERERLVDRRWPPPRAPARWRAAASMAAAEHVGGRRRRRRRATAAQGGARPDGPELHSAARATTPRRNARAQRLDGRARLDAQLNPYPRRTGYPLRGPRGGTGCAAWRARRGRRWVCSEEHREE